MKLRFLSALAVALLAMFATSPAHAAERGPNVILILADDMAVGDLASLNGGITRTPNLDRLKSESVWFNQAYSASSVCAPARAALLTGRYPHRTGAVTLNMEKYPKLCRIRKDETTMADIFKANGYATGLIGKWHSGLGEDYHPLKRGFDEFQGFIGATHVKTYFQYQLDLQGDTHHFTDKYLTEDLSARALDYVRRHREHPFFLHLAHYAPHRPMSAPEDRIQPFLDAGFDPQTATVYAMIEIMDEGIGQLLDELNRLDLTRNTIVIFASDNGPDPVIHSRFNLDLRGTKYEVHEGGIRVPFMFRWTGKYEKALREDPVHFTDVLPTLIELCDLKLPKPLALDGASFVPALEGKAAELPEHRFWQWNRFRPLYGHNAAVREGPWKLVRPFVTRNLPKGDSDLPPALYDLSTDPSEANDVSAEHADRTKRMNTLLDAWCKEVEADRTRPGAE